MLKELLEQEILIQHIPIIGNIYITINCIEIVDSIENINSRSNQWNIIIPLRSISHRNIISIITALIISYIYSNIYNAKIAKKPWIEPLLYLEGKRNIKEVIDKYEPRIGDKAILLSISRTEPAPLKNHSIKYISKHTCFNALKRIPIDRKDITRISTFPIRERIFKLI